MAQDNKRQQQDMRDNPDAARKQASLGQHNKDSPGGGSVGGPAIETGTGDPTGMGKGAQDRGRSADAERAKT